MDLRLTPEMEAVRDEVRTFLANHRDHYAGEASARPREAALQWQRLLIDNGYAARTIPKAYGGYGAEPAVCRGYYDAHGDEVAALVLARAKGKLVEDAPPVQASRKETK